MNICSFTGFMLEDPALNQRENVSYLEFKLITYSYRRAKSTGEKSRVPTLLNFEAWHTGAETIAKLAQRGDKMSVYASARNKSKDDSIIVFRVNEFDFGCLNPE